MQGGSHYCFVIFRNNSCQIITYEQVLTRKIRTHTERTWEVESKRGEKAGEQIERIMLSLGKYWGFPINDVT